MKHRGAIGELKACIWLLDQGYDVFRNVSQHGNCDILARKEDEILSIDVKTAANYITNEGELRYYERVKPEDDILWLNYGAQTDSFWWQGDTDALILAQSLFPRSEALGEIYGNKEDTT